MAAVVTKECEVNYGSIVACNNQNIRQFWSSNVVTFFDGLGHEQFLFFRVASPSSALPTAR
jgi:hypothetical protein